MPFTRPRRSAMAVLALLVASAHPAIAADEALDSTRLAHIGPVVERAIADHELPGAVVLVGRGDQVVYREAFGNRAVVPSREAMTLDTVFDLASLTKVVATTTSVMLLVERGQLRLEDAVSRYIPEFARYGKQRITIRHLLTHVSGLRPDLDLALEFDGHDEGIRLACEEVPVAAPGERFIYSDINFLLLGEIVGRVSGRRLDRFAADEIFGPLGMRDTRFLPPDSERSRIAPTESCTPRGWPCGPGSGASMLRGVVHDPTARRMGGVAGHAGLFSTADDLSRFCRMLLHGGTLDGTRLLSPLSVALMTRTATRAGVAQRGLGWDIDSRYASNRGDLFPIGSFGHTGWTGTSLWIDPASDVYVVFLTNRVHPDGKGDVVALRGRIASIVASAIPDPHVTAATVIAGADFGPTPAPLPVATKHEPVMTGIDVLEAERFARLRGRRIGLLTNQTARTRGGTTTIEALRAAPGLTLAALFSPEHGLGGTADEKIASGRDDRTGLPVHSLYGDALRPTPAMLQGLDAIVIDLQDVGTRFYTYTATMGYMLEAAAERHVPVFVLDRPNPVNGFEVEGPTPEAAAIGLTAYYPLPTRHGLTIGELAKLFNGERKIGADLTVVPMRHWARGEWFDETGLDWINPSPNMRNLNQATLYPGIGSIEAANISVGRGTDQPFEQLGAPWIDGRQLAEALNARSLPGIRFYPVSFTPAASKYAGEPCGGVFMVVTDREALRPVRVGIEVASALFRLYPDRFDPGDTWRLLGSRALVKELETGADPAEISRAWQAGEGKWRDLRAKYLLYDGAGEAGRKNEE